MTITYTGTRTTAPTGQVVVEVRGKIDVYTATQLKRDLHEALAAAPEGLVIDMSDVDFIDSSGLGVLLGVLRRCNEQHASLALVMTAGGVRKIFTITGLDKVFAISATREEGLRAAAAED